MIRIKQTKIIIKLTNPALDNNEYTKPSAVSENDFSSRIYFLIIKNSVINPTTKKAITIGISNPLLFAALFFNINVTMENAIHIKYLTKSVPGDSPTRIITSSNQ